MKKNKLYTVNKFNMPLFLQGFEKENIFWPGGNMSWGNFAQNNPAYTSGSISYTPVTDMNSLNATASGNNGSLAGGIGEGASGGKGSFMNSGAAKMGMGIGMNLADSIGRSEEFKRGLWDRLDPVHYLAGGRESAVGNALGDAGVATFKASAQQGNGIGMIVGAGLKIAGGLGNAAFGIKVDKQRLKHVNQGIKSLSNFNSGAASFDDIKGVGALTNAKDIYEGGWFSQGKADDKNEELNRRYGNALGYAYRSIDQNISNINKDQTNNFLANYAAFGGPFEQFNDNNDMGAIGYGLMSDYLSNKKQEIAQKNKVGGITSIPTFMNGFALGGDIQMHGGDYTSGLVHIDAGGSHSENPYDGVQMGVDNEGTPNLVEENETVWNDYVFSNRILADEETKRMFRLPKKQEITFSDISKKLEKEIAERPADPISKAGFNAQMQKLEEQQERQKQEMEAERAREAFEALSPEEQAAIMQQREQQEAMAQQAAQEQAIAEQQAMQQPSPEEGAMIQQQTDGTEADLGQEAPMMAEGGHLFSKGGELKKRIYKLLGIHTDSEFNKWAKDNNITAFQDRVKDIAWDRVFENTAFVDALSKDNPALKDALTKGYDFGAYVPDNTSNVTFKDISRGNWTAQDYAGWKDSQDPAWLEAVEKGLVREDMKQEEIADALRQTDKYKQGTKWLQDSEDNRLRYLRTILEDENSPEVAKNYARKFIDENGWKEGVSRDYASIFGADGKGVRETHPGTYWHTPIEAVRGSEAKNWIINDDGTVEEIIGDIPTDWTSAGDYSWATPENDYAYKYYRRPGTATPSGTTGTTAGEERDIEPVLLNDKYRYAGLFGPAVGLGMQMAGIGRPDTSQLDAAISGAGNYHKADYQTIGNYLTYRPLDIWYAQNAMDAQARATDRALLNSSSPSRTAGLLANGLNSQIASGNLFRQAQEYNDAMREKVESFNRGTNQYNADAYTKNSMFNASAANDALSRGINARLHAAQAKMDADAGWYNGIYGNVSGLFKGISDLGRENRETSWRNALVTAGAFGAMDDDALVRADIARYKNGKKASNGGKLKKGKRGLTY